MQTCLIVEDSAVIRTIMAEMLKELGLSPVECATATEAVDYCRQDHPPVVFLDWDLPSLGALDFLRGVGGLPTDERPHIVLCATENDPQQFALAHAAGAAHHLLKPFDKRRLAVKLADIGVLEEAAVPSADGNENGSDGGNLALEEDAPAQSAPDVASG
ncbi:MAG: response regulator [Pseudomonadota bacterium]